MPVTKFTHDEGQFFIIDAPAVDKESGARYTGTRMGIDFAHGQARLLLDYWDLARQFSEMGYDVTVPTGDEPVSFDGTGTYPWVEAKEDQPVVAAAVPAYASRIASREPQAPKKGK